MNSGRAAQTSRRLACAAILAASLALAACLSTKVETLAPNMVRLYMTGDDSPSDQDALRDLLALAAKETIARGYELFRLSEMKAEPAGPGAGGSSAPRVNFSVLVAMFHEGEQGFNVVFNARQILAASTPPG
jgi:outer membrane murein-binding lipoprotein Lpp